MIYINNNQSQAEQAYTAMVIINDAPEEVLFLQFPKSEHEAIRQLLADVQEITDEQERTIRKYLPTICYDIADMEEKTYAKLRISSWTESANPNYVGELDKVFGTVQKQEEEIALLKGCIMELSDVVYGEGGETV